MNHTLGILGGLGPLASADFLLSIYEHNMGRKEQEAPALVLYSDPNFPDRTTAFMEGRDDLLLKPLEAALLTLRDCRVNRIVIACVTIHHLLRRISPHLQKMTISLTDVVLDAVVFSQKPALLLATEGTRRMRVFEANEHWREAAPFIVLPDDADQRTIHHCIYNELKTNSAPGNVVEFLRRLCDKYAVTQLIAGCTELHRVSRYLLSPVSSSMPAQIIDPLLIIAQNYKEFVHEQIQPYGRLCRQLHPLCQ